jgi:hypothetical protein
MKLRSANLFLLSRSHSPQRFAALRELHAASPVPPQPLRQEEKMLLPLIHTGGPQESAMLNSEVRAEHEAEADIEFRQFFGQVMPKITSEIDRC